MKVEPKKGNYEEFANLPKGTPFKIYSEDNFYYFMKTNRYYDGSAETKINAVNLKTGAFKKFGDFTLVEPIYGRFVEE